MPGERTTLEDTKRWLAHLRHSGADLFCEVTRPTVTPLDLLEADHMMKHELAFWEGVQRSMDELASKRQRCLAAKEDSAAGKGGDFPVEAARGRLLVYMPDFELYWQLNEGSPIVDKFNVPAWDMWVGVSMPQDAEFDHENPDRAIVAWVPSWYNADAEEALIGAPLGELAWIEEPRFGRIRCWAAGHGLLE